MPEVSVQARQREVPRATTREHAKCMDHRVSLPPRTQVEAPAAASDREERVGGNADALCPECDDHGSLSRILRDIPYCVDRTVMFPL